MTLTFFYSQGMILKEQRRQRKQHLNINIIFWRRRGSVRNSEGEIESWLCWMFWHGLLPLHQLWLGERSKCLLQEITPRNAIGPRMWRGSGRSQATIPAFQQQLGKTQLTQCALNPQYITPFPLHMDPVKMLPSRWGILHSPFLKESGLLNGTYCAHPSKEYRRGNLTFLRLRNGQWHLVATPFKGPSLLKMEWLGKKKKKKQEIALQANVPKVLKSGQENIPSHRVNEAALKDENSQGSLEIYHAPLLPPKH